MAVGTPQNVKLILKLQRQSFESYGDSSFSSSTSSKRLSRRKPKKNQEGDILKTFKELCQIEVLKTIIGEGKETSNKKLRKELKGSKLKILSMLSQIESSMRT